MEVDLEDGDGRPITDHAELFFDAELLPSDGRDESYPDLGFRRTSNLVAENGHFDLGMVERGFELGLSAECPGFTFPPETALAPECSGETVHVVMRATGPRADRSRPESAPSIRDDSDSASVARDAAILQQFGPSADWSSVELTFHAGNDVDLALLDLKLTDAQQREISERTHVNYTFDTANGGQGSGMGRPPIEVVDFPREATKVMRAVPPGTYTVSVFGFGMARTEEMLVEFRDVLVPPHCHVRDPRLRDLDLRAVAHRRVVTVTDEEGHPLTGFASVELAPHHDATAEDGRGVGETPDEDAYYSWFFSEGQLDLTFAPIAVRFVVAADGFRPRTFDSLSDGQRIVLKRGIPIRISLESPPSLPGGITLEVLVRREGTSRWTRIASSWGDVLRSGSARFCVPSPGRLEVGFKFGLVDGGFSTGSDEFSTRLAPIEVKESSEEQHFVVAPDAEAFERELAAICGEREKHLRERSR
jgi:hypothetical protein